MSCTAKEIAEKRRQALERLKRTKEVRKIVCISLNLLTTATCDFFESLIRNMPNRPMQ